VTVAHIKVDLARNRPMLLVCWQHLATFGTEYRLPAAWSLHDS